MAVLLAILAGAGALAATFRLFFESGTAFARALNQWFIPAVFNRPGRDLGTNLRAKWFVFSWLGLGILAGLAVYGLSLVWLGSG